MRTCIFSCIFLAAALSGHPQKKRIVSLAASITQTLYAIGANDEMVGCTRFCLTDPEDSIPVVADAVNVNLEKIVSLRPDLVIASGLTPPKILDGLDRMGITTKRLKEPRNFEEICRQCLILGELSGRAEEARELTDRARERLGNLRAGLRGRASPKVFMEIGSDPLFAALPGSFMHDYIVQAGGENIAEPLGSAVVSKEYVLLRNPDVILVVGMGVVGEEEVRKWAAVRSLSAAKNGRIYVLDQYICSPTPATFVDTVEKLVSLLSGQKTEGDAKAVR